MFGADIGKTLAYGIIIAVPSIVIAGPLFSRTLKRIKASPIEEFVNQRILQDEEMPGILSSILITLLPVLLIGIALISAMIFPVGP